MSFYLLKLVKSEMSLVQIQKSNLMLLLMTAYSAFGFINLKTINKNQSTLRQKTFLLIHTKCNEGSDGNSLN
jgi:hypothetical protein